MTREPDVFKATITLEGAASKERWFFARKGPKWRIDHFANGSPLLSEINADAHYAIDHTKRTYAIQQAMGTTQPAPDLAYGFFRAKDYHKFEKLGDENGLSVYRIAPDETLKDDVIIYVDDKTGLMTRQILKGSDGTEVVWQLSDVSFEVEDSIFGLPAGYSEEHPARK